MNQWERIEVECRHYVSRQGYSTTLDITAILSRPWDGFSRWCHSMIFGPAHPFYASINFELLCTRGRYEASVDAPFPADDLRRQAIRAYRDFMRLAGPKGRIPA